MSTPMNQGLDNMRDKRQKRRDRMQSHLLVIESDEGRIPDRIEDARSLGAQRVFVIFRPPGTSRLGWGGGRFFKLRCTKTLLVDFVYTMENGRTLLGKTKRCRFIFHQESTGFMSGG